MRTSGTPDGSVRACLVAILERDDVPAPPADHPEPLTVWRNWLGILGLGLVPIQVSCVLFNWPGPWVAVLADGRAAVAFGAPPGLAWAPPGARFEDVVEGFVIAPVDVALWTPPSRRTRSRRAGSKGCVVAAVAEGPPHTVDEAVAHAGRGLEGDRYFDGRGTFSNTYARGHDLTLVRRRPGGATRSAPVAT